MWEYPHQLLVSYSLALSQGRKDQLGSPHQFLDSYSYHFPLPYLYYRNLASYSTQIFNLSVKIMELLEPLELISVPMKVVTENRQFSSFLFPVKCLCTVFNERKKSCLVGVFCLCLSCEK